MGTPPYFIPIIGLSKDAHRLIKGYSKAYHTPIIAFSKASHPLLIG